MLFVCFPMRFCHTGKFRAAGNVSHCRQLPHGALSRPISPNFPEQFIICRPRARPVAYAFPASFGIFRLPSPLCHCRPFWTSLAIVAGFRQFFLCRDWQPKRISPSCRTFHRQAPCPFFFRNFWHFVRVCETGVIRRELPYRHLAQNTGSGRKVRDARKQAGGKNGRRKVDMKKGRQLYAIGPDWEHVMR